MLAQDAIVDAVMDALGVAPALAGGQIHAWREFETLPESVDEAVVVGWVSSDPLQRRYGELHLPLAVLYGRGDRILDPAAQGQALVDQVPGAVLELIDGGHMLPMTQADRCVAMIRRVAERQKEARAA